ncbi:MULTISPECIES: twin-arginine translocase subunit TatC [unclassified Pseudoclavibacter]|uniref:twin-arginine translocase subunit TatC n=1 Tax=unclassified Pseudoclavibacter TaxID=2615177 RepID=UPI00280070C6|nr:MULTISPECIES: twin-arginine translocase subunit TatC [unclassified Pseudoclavibacter]
MTLQPSEGPSPAGVPKTTPKRAKKDRKRDPDGRMRLAEHLIEFRNRLIISAIGIVLGMVGGFLLTDWVFNLMSAPIHDIAVSQGRTADLNFQSITGAFDLRLQISLALGVILSSPVWLYQIWMFVVPGLKKNERWYAIGFVGTAIPLFLAGVWVAWLLMPRIVEVMVSFAPSDSSSLINAGDYYKLIMTLCIAVGIAFVLPVILVMLNFAGVITGSAILKGWRTAVLLVALFAAMATPSADVLSMFFLMAPMLGLYFLAVGIAMINDRRRAKKHKKFEAELAAAEASAA